MGAKFSIPLFLISPTGLYTVNKCQTKCENIVNISLRISVKVEIPNDSPELKRDDKIDFE